MDKSNDWISKKIDKFIVVNKVLGKGSFGTVYRGFFEDNQKKLVAVKLISIKDMIDSDLTFKLIKREINILQQFDNKNIVKLYDVARTPNNLYMFLEFCMDGDLKDYLKSKKNNTLSEPEATMFFRHIVEGFKDLYNNNIIHRDIKPANIMLHKGCAKISDFGFSRFVDNHKEVLMTRLGSPLYMAPQILEGEPFSSKCDVWSLGIVFFEMLYGRSPWTGTCQIDLLNNIKSEPLEFPNELVRSEKVKSLIRNMLEMKESERFGWNDVLNDEVLVGVKIKLEKNLIFNEYQEDFLEKSITLNETYIQTNLIANYLRNIDEIKNEEKLNPEPKANLKAKDTNQMQYDSLKDEQLIKKMIDNEKMHKNIMKVNEYVLYERNISMFYNYVIQKIIRAFNFQTIQIKEDLYFRVIFVTCKFQNQNLLKVNTLLNEKQNHFNASLWEYYSQSEEYIKSLRLLKQDIIQSKRFFRELLRKTTEVIQKGFKKDAKYKLVAFFNILNENFIQDTAFNQIYQKTLNEFFSALWPIVCCTRSKDILVIIRYLTVCQNPYIEFNNSDYDFNKFYEEIEAISIEDLRKQIQQKIN